MLPTTALYASALGALLLALSFNVIRLRRATDTSLGDGEDVRLTRAIRAQGNFTEYAPLALILMAVLELNGADAKTLHLIGASLLLGRLLHGYCLACTRSSMWSRVSGMLLTFAALVIALAACLKTAIL